MMFKIVEYDKAVTVRNHPSHPGENSFIIFNPNRRPLCMKQFDEKEIDFKMTLGQTIEVLGASYKIIGTGKENKNHFHTNNEISVVKEEKNA